MQPGDCPAKRVTRGRVRRSRASRGVGDAAAVERALAAHAASLVALARPHVPSVLTVALYVSMPGEPGTAALRRQWATTGHRVLLPWLQDDLDLDWVLDPGGSAPPDPLRPPGRRLGPGALGEADLVLVPALAVDEAGTRLGQGGGSYDRALRRLPPVGAPGPARAPVLAVVHDDEVLPAGTLPVQAHDVAVDGVLTPGGARLLGGSVRA